MNDELREIIRNLIASAERDRGWVKVDPHWFARLKEEFEEEEDE